MGKHPTISIFHQYFLSDGHNRLMNDSETTYMDKMDPTRRESFWMGVLKTIAPFGLKVDEDYNH